MADNKQTLSAFPYEFRDPEAPGDTGMSLRDYFAGQVIAGRDIDTMIDNAEQWESMKEYPHKDLSTDDKEAIRARVFDDVAVTAYQIADAMLKARESQP